MIQKKINGDLIEKIEVFEAPTQEKDFKLVRQSMFKRIKNFLTGTEPKKRMRIGDRSIFTCYIYDLDKFFIKNKDVYFLRNGLVYRNPNVEIKMVSDDDVYIKHFKSKKDLHNWLDENVNVLRLITI